jgi:hypothetical protein
MLILFQWFLCGLCVTSARRDSTAAMILQHMTAFHSQQGMCSIISIVLQLL